VTDSAPAHEHAPEGVITFPEGIPGFPHAHRFVLSDLDDEGTFQLLDCLDDEHLSMVVCIPWLLFPDYAPEIDPVTQADLGLERPEDAIVFVSVTVEPDDEALYCNLLGPFVVNARTLRGRQVVQHDVELPVRASVPLAS
jgi:flagellar assembly factor FliW